MIQKISLVIIIMTLIVFTSCDDSEKNKYETTKLDEVVQKVEVNKVITKQEVLDIQNIWSNGIIRIGKVYTEKGDYKTEAENHINALYGYNLGKVLFKPTLASETQFRLTKEGALSYFVGHNENFSEDHGFAINPWINIRWESIGIKIEGNMAIAMGNYYFTPADGGEDVKVEYTFAYTKDEDNKLRIIMHGSHLPYSPNNK